MLTAINILTGKVRMLVEVFPPLFADIHRLCISTCSLSRKPLGLSVLNHIADMLWVYRIENSVEVFAIRVSVGRIIILQIQHHFSIVFELRKDVPHTQLIVLGHVDRVSLADFEQPLFALKHGSDEVPVHGGPRGHIQLDCISIIRGFQNGLTLVLEVVEEVLLRTEAVGELIGQDGFSIVAFQI